MKIHKWKLKLLIVFSSCYLIYVVYSVMRKNTDKTMNSYVDVPNVLMQSHLQQLSTNGIVRSVFPAAVIAKTKNNSYNNYANVLEKYQNKKIIRIVNKDKCTADRRKIRVRQHRKLYQILMHNNEKIYIYKVYYDDRESHWSKKYIQVLAVGEDFKETIYAHMWFGNKIKSRSVYACSVTKHGRDSSIDKKIYSQYFFSCEIRINDIPKYISMSFDNCTAGSNLLNVNVPEKKRKHKFSICVETGYGHIDPTDIVEFVEFNKLMGVTLISVYPCNISTNNMKVFQQYEKEGIMKIYRTPSPLEDTSWKKQMLSSPISFNDCMLRQMYSAEYIIPLDFDEIIVPRLNSKNYSDLLKEIDAIYKAKEPFAIYLIRTFIFFTTCRTKVTNLKFGKTHRFLNRLSRFGHTKSIVNPRKCLSVFNHYCKVNFPRIKGPGVIFVDTSIATVNHYRKAWSKRFCSILKSDNITDSLAKDTFGKMLWKPFYHKLQHFKRLKLI